ncbi:MAG: hypothetical protein R2747_17110 [Pyrinomonadaceae bacterium]
MRKTENLSNRTGVKLFLIGAMCLLFAGFAWSGKNSPAGDDQAVRAAAEREPNPELAKAAFSEAFKVFASPRCANCHPAGDVPTQGDEMALHAQGVTRGADGKGKYGMKCATCHQSENLEGDHMPPGVSTGWHMPPADMKMVFQGLTAGQLCRQLKDPKMNGGRKTLEEAIEHLEKDPLVHWGWKPGNGRTTPPLSYEEFMKNIHEWVENGGDCPE